MINFVNFKSSFMNINWLNWSTLTKLITLCSLSDAQRIDASLTPTALPPRDADIRDVDSHKSKTGFVQTYYVHFAFAFM